MILQTLVTISLLLTTKISLLGPLTQDWSNYAKIAGGGTGNQFKGIIDEFYIFNCSLIDEQVRVVADTCKLREGVFMVPFLLVL